MQTLLIPASDHFYLSCALYRVEKPKAVVQIIHGASEYKGRYEQVARALQSAGYVVLVSDQRGHGESTSAPFVRGFMPPLDVLVADQWAITEYLIEEFAAPVVLLSHSFGANIARICLARHDRHYRGLIMSGAPFYVRGIGVAKKMTELSILLFGPHTSPLVTSKLTTSASLKWVCSDPAVIEERRTDPYRKNFRYQLASIHTIFDSVKRLHAWDEYRVENPEMPILFISGSDDPIPGGKVGLATSKHALRRVGYKNVSSTVFAGMRHEVLMEREKERVFSVIISFLETIVQGGSDNETG
ncbi:MAG: alpha/beta fold hydrolase [Sphaerochaeta sp.]|jgi:alpha-beta hydrolase superfamily lysophospholipase